MHSNQQEQPTEDQLHEAERNGVLRWKEYQDIEHIKTAVPGCACGLCETVRSLLKKYTTDKSRHESASVIRRVDLLLKMR